MPSEIVVDVTETVVIEIPTGQPGPQGNTGATGPQGPVGPTGVVAATAPVTYNAETKTVGISTDGNLETVSGALKVTDVLTAIDKIAFDTAAGMTATAGQFTWNDAAGTLDLGLKGGNVTLQLGQEQVQLVKSADNVGLDNGQVVYVVGSNGGNMTVRLAKADTEGTSSKTFGVMTESTTGGNKGFATTFGMVHDLNTASLTEGAAVWLSATVSGGLTTTKPAPPAHSVFIGWCVRSHAVNGELFVNIQNGYELDELHNVEISSPADNQVLTYESSSGLWKNKTNTVDGVQSITFSSPLTGGTITTTGMVGLDQAGITLAQSQVTNLVSDLSGKANLTGGNTLTGLQTVNTGAAGTIGIQVNTVASPTTHMQVWSVNGSYRAVVDKNGFMVVGGSTALGNITSYSFGTGQIPMVARGASGQTADLQQWQDSTAAVKAKVGATGDMTFGYAYTSGLRDGAGTGAYLNMQATNAILVNARTATNKGLIVQAAASQSANLQEWQDSTGAVLSNFDSFGRLRVRNSTTSAYSAAIGAASAATVGLLVQGAASQSSDLTQWQNSAGSVIAKVDAFGGIGWAAVGTLGSGNSGAYISMVKQTAATTNPGAGSARLYFRDGTNAGTLKLVVRAGAAGAETTILDNIPQ